MSQTAVIYARYSSHQQRDVSIEQQVSACRKYAQENALQILRVYDDHAMIYYASDMPHPTKEHEAFLEEGIQRLKQILDISEGRALVLFTSKSDMRRVAKALKMMGSPYKVLTQATGSSQKEVLEAFRKDEHAEIYHDDNCHVSYSSEKHLHSPRSQKECSRHKHGKYGKNNTADVSEVKISCKRNVRIEPSESPVQKKSQCNKIGRADEKKKLCHISVILSNPAKHYEVFFNVYPFLSSLEAIL